MSATELLALVAFVEFGGIIALGVVLIVSRSQLKGVRTELERSRATTTKRRRRRSGVVNLNQFWR
jgi:adenylate cyclase